MIYVSIFIFISCATIKHCLQKSKHSYTYILLTVFLITFSILRYGSGTDYFSYMWHYKVIPTGFIEAIKFNESYMEIGFKGLMGFFKQAKLSFEEFSGVISFLVMILFTYTIYKNSKFKLLSLLMFYCIYYHIYVNSGIRQGLAMAIFFLAFYRYLKNECVNKYIILIIFASFFHKSVLITLLIPLATKFAYKNFNNYVLNFTIILISLLLYFFHVERIIYPIISFVGFYDNYFDPTTGNLLSILLRVINIGFIYFLYKNNRYSGIDKFEKLTIYIYFLGVVFYICFARIQMVSRLTEYFTIFEVILTANLILKNKNLSMRILCTMFCILIVGAVFIKDLKSFTVQGGGYYSKDILDYPYVSVFNKEDIFQYRYIRDLYIP